MIHQNFQSSLFPTSKMELLELLDLTAVDLKKWQELGYLSATFAEVDALDASTVLEILFASKLVKSVPNELFLNHLLSKLEKPYCYNYDAVYFDVFTDEWCYLPIEKPIDAYNFEDIVMELLEDCDREVQISTISDFISVLSERLKEL